MQLPLAFARLRSRVLSGLRLCRLCDEDLDGDNLADPARVDVECVDRAAPERRRRAMSGRIRATAHAPHELADWYGHRKIFAMIKAAAERTWGGLPEPATGPPDPSTYYTVEAPEPAAMAAGAAAAAAAAAAAGLPPPPPFQLSALAAKSLASLSR